MTLAETLLASILGALAVSLTTSAVHHIASRVRVRAALLADIRLHLAGAKEQADGVRALVDNQVCEGATIPFPISYALDEYVLYKSLQRDLPRYLSKLELIRTIKFYHAVWELDVAINGLTVAIAQWHNEKTPLSAEHVAHMRRRKQRIESLIEALVQNRVIEKLKDLPDDYRGVKGPDTVLATRSPSSARGSSSPAGRD